MRKLIGSAAILFACFWAAHRRMRQKRERIRLLEALGTSLLELRGELAERQRSLGELFHFQAQRSENLSVRAFYDELCSEMKGLGEQGFSEIWRSAVGSSFSMTGEKVCGILNPLGGCLGGSELDRQCSALEKAAGRLAEEERAEREKLTSERRLSFGLSLSAGAFMVIILV